MEQLVLVVPQEKDVVRRTVPASRFREVVVPGPVFADPMAAAVDTAAAPELPPAAAFDVEDSPSASTRNPPPCSMTSVLSSL